jgi:hypothetical protein
VDGQATTIVRIFELHGTVVVEDKLGQEHAEEGGMLTLRLSPQPNEMDDRPQSRGLPLSIDHGPPGTTTIPVSQGKWTARFECPEGIDWVHVAIGTLMLGGREALPASWHTISVPRPEDAEPIQVRAFWPGYITLRIRGEDTGKDLEQVDVAVVPDVAGPDLTDPLHLFRRGARSPVALPSVSGTRVVWARAPGYAWGRLSVDLYSGGDHELLLSRAAHLEVELQGAVRPAKAWLRLYSGDEALPEHLFAAVRPEPRTLLTSLPPGLCVVRVELDTDRWEPEVLGATSVNLPAGVETQVLLRVSELPPAPDPVPFAGSVIFAPGNVPSDFTLTIRRERWVRTFFTEGEEFPLLRRMADDPPTWSWNAGTVPPGSYQCSVHPLSKDWPGIALDQEVEVGPTGAKETSLVVAEHAIVELSLLERDTRKGVSLELFWSLPEERQFPRGIQSVAEGRYRFFAPVGVVSVFGVRSGTPFSDPSSHSRMGMRTPSSRAAAIASS